MELQLRQYTLKLKHTFSISRESHDYQDSLVVCLSHQGQTGYGEATSNPYYNITSNSMCTEIEGVRAAIEEHDFINPETFNAFLLNKKLSNFSRCALDMAAHDLYGKLLQKPLYELWETDTQSYPITNYTIGIAPIAEMLAKMQEKPWPIYKVKLGTDNDVALVKALRQHTDAVFRIDANCAWTAEQTLAYAPQLKALGVEFLEQPLKADDWEGMAKLAQECALPIIADESCILEKDVAQCAPYFDGINIKLTKCGGLTPALRMIQKAKELDLKVMVGCMTESTVGISAIAQLCPQLDYVDMDGAMLLKEDIATGIKIQDQGKLLFPSLGGTGVQLLDLP